MQRIQLAYTIGGAPAPQQSALSNDLMTLLHAVQTQGSIVKAAQALALSYRHVWGELKRWEAQLGSPLLLWERGQPARLAPFGERLLYADKQAQARLTAQLEALQAELERSLALAFDPQAQVLSMQASHDEALALLRGHAATAKLYLDVAFSGSIEALRALNDGRCSVAGFHVRMGAGADSHAAKTYRPLLQPGLHKIMGFVQRSQGLIVAHGNPLKIRSLADVAQRGMRYVNRPAGTGTRVLLDELLTEQGIAKTQLQGYRKTEPSHQAAALCVSQGLADAALGIEVAAKALGLNFVPLVQERYMLVCHKEVLTEPSFQALAKLLRSAAWRNRLAGVAGYAALDSGKVLKMASVLPWWRF
jgi:putative molybdopterin biosynthesis protein